MPSPASFSKTSRAMRAANFLFMAAAFCSPGRGAAKHTSSPPAKRTSHAARVQTGIDVLESQKFAPLRGKRVGLITNHTGVDSQGLSTSTLLARAPGVHLVALFSPEHGIAGRLDEKVSSTRDSSTGLPVYSLYGETNRPSDAMLEGIDTLVFDIQDAGVRFYTYTTTLAYCMEEAAKRNISFFVLDRPDPINGETIEGPMLDTDKTSFTAYYPLPIRYGLTIGELAQFLNAENHISVDLHIIAMKKWHRNYFYESTGLRWIPPSPNLLTQKGAILYPGLEILQNAGVSVGRGTETPFEEFGAPWINGDDVAAALNNRHLPGVRFVNQPFVPISGLYAGQHCGGVGVKVVDRASVRSVRVGIEIAVVLQKLYPSQFDPAKLQLLTGNFDTIQQLQSATPPEHIVSSWGASLAAFDRTRHRYLIYK